jgi:hypothetical protein
MRFEKEPGEPQESDVSRTLEAGFDSLEKLPPEVLKRLLGEHLAEERIHSHAEGRLDFEAAQKETFHLALCDICSDKVLGLEGELMAHIRADQDKVVDLTVDSFIEEAPKDTKVIAGRNIAPHRRAELLCCRSLRLDLVWRDKFLFLEIEADAAPEIAELKVVNSSTGRRLSISKELTDQRLTVNLGPVNKLTDQPLDVSFKYQDDRWARRFRFRAA